MFIQDKLSHNKKGNIMFINTISSLFNFDALTCTIMTLVLFVGSVVTVYAGTYMQGDRRYKSFMILLCLLIISVMMMAAADNLPLLLATWTLSNFLLVKLMIHKPEWQAAKNSGLLTAKTFLIGVVALAIAFGMIYAETGETSIKLIFQKIDDANPDLFIPTLLILVAAMTQSAIWPFHRWLVSSLNSPTPVSALMHAGLVNGGGLLLIRFAPLFIYQPDMLIGIFIFGLITAMIGTLWKLMQNDIKKMLACSTMGQMGFMFMQCGLGLFPVALAHLFWHGLFKANLFLSSAGVSVEKRKMENVPVTVKSTISAVLCAALATSVFAYINDGMGLALDTSILLLGMIFITACQLASSILLANKKYNLLSAIFASLLLAIVYGMSVRYSDYLMSSLELMKPQPLNIMHIIGCVAILGGWLLMFFKDNLKGKLMSSNTFSKFYVKALNASQPHPSTVTGFRNQYKY